MDIALIHPPVSRPCEPPAGLAKLAGALKDHGKSCLIIDAGIEGPLSLLNGTRTAQDTWTRRAVMHREENLAAVRAMDTYRSMGRYTRAVNDLNRILQAEGERYNTLLSLHNFQHNSLSPVRSEDLVRSAEQPEGNVFFPYFEKRFSSMMEDHAPGMVGFSLNYLGQALTTFAMIGFLKRLDPGVRIILGGGLVTSWMRRPGRSISFAGLVDEMVDGPGEGRILGLLGSGYSERDSLPDYDSFPDNDYFSPGRVLPFSASSGCYWGRCSFCPEKAEGNPYSCIPAEAVPSSLDMLAEKNDPCLIHICDNALSPALLKAMARRETGVPWYGFARFTRHLTDPDFCRTLRNSGCVMLKLGLESGDQKVLDELGKGIRLDEAARALKALTEAGIATYAYLLFGTPAENREGARKTLDFIAENSSSIDFLNISIFNLPRDSAEATGLKTYEFSEGDLSLYQGFVHPKGWDRNKVRQFLDKEFKRHPAIAGIVRRDPPVFTSNHAPFFVMKRE
jgi:radical SAM superfamily enzyme YgiQ (UPF0313 family)